LHFWLRKKLGAASNSTAGELNRIAVRILPLVFISGLEQ
jgi:hypothetical protein